MADTAETLDLSGTPRRMAPVTPIRPLEPEPSIAESHTGVGDRVFATYQDVKSRAAESISQLSGQAKQNNSRVREFVAKARHERPVQVLAAVAGAAFVLGVLLRVWRSSHYEYHSS